MADETRKYRRKKNRIWLVATVFTLLGSGVTFVGDRFVYPRLFPPPHFESTPPPIATTVEEEENVEVVPKVVDWVMKKSTRVPRSIAEVIVRECCKTDYPVVLLALIARESSFNPFARSKAGAIGLGQILPKVWLDELRSKGLVREVRDLYDPVINIRCTNYIFVSYLRKSNNDLSTALVRYVGGKNSAYVKDILLNIGELVVILGDKILGREKEECVDGEREGQGRVGQSR